MTINPDDGTPVSYTFILEWTPGVSFDPVYVDLKFNTDPPFNPISNAEADQVAQELTDLLGANPGNFILVQVNAERRISATITPTE